MYSFWSNVVSTTIVGGSCSTQDLFGGGQSVEFGHPDVHERDLRLGQCRLTDGLFAVFGFSDDLDVTLGLQDHPEAGADELLVVGDEDPDHPLDRVDPRRRTKRP